MKPTWRQRWIDWWMATERRRRIYHGIKRLDTW